MVIRGKDRLGYMTGAIAALVENDRTYASWESDNSIVMAWLVNSMEKKIGRHYLSYKMTKEI